MKYIKTLLMVIGAISLFTLLIFAASLYFASSKLDEEEYLAINIEVKALLSQNFKNLEYDQISSYLNQEIKNKDFQETLALIKSELVGIKYIGAQIDGFTNLNTLTNHIEAHHVYEVEFDNSKGTIEIELSKNNKGWIIHKLQISKMYVNF